MHVIATAGHVDHGKSTLVRTLTGMEPDRLAEERRRGLTIDLGFAWTTLPTGRHLAFVDVPGHERFVGNMLAGVGPAPAVMFVVAADEGWGAQSAEHLAALNALNVTHGLAVVTKSDLADPGPAIKQIRAELSGTSLASAEIITVSGRTGDGLDGLVDALTRLVEGLPDPDPHAAVRLWIDRVFTVAGAGTVVTGTLPAGTLRVGDELRIHGDSVRIRGLETLKERANEVSGVARVAANLRGVARHSLARGVALVTPGAWLYTATVDVELDVTADNAPRRGGEYMLHIGSAAVPSRIRPLGDHAARLTLARELPLRVGDRALLRDPAAHEIAAGVQVLDVCPRPLRRRGDAAARAAELASGVPDAAGLLRWHGLLARSDLLAMGGRPTPDLVDIDGQWLADPEHWETLRIRLTDVVDKHTADSPLDGGLSVRAAARNLSLPSETLVEALVRPPLLLRSGRITLGATSPPEVTRAVEQITEHLHEAPFQAPDAEWLATRGIDRKIIAAADREGALLDLGDGIALLVDAPIRAAEILGDLPQPFAVSQARRALNTTRRVAVPLLEHLDDRGLTCRLEDNTRLLMQ